ncbi:MAG: hypothetical protein MH204_06345 [Fimbriimonadaceae bacterium]|nr:hypothetical protein [Fimbriimonadaceae bacterium]
MIVGTLAAVLLAQAAAPADPGVPIEPAPKVLRKFPADEAQQGVAVDRDSVFVIGNRVIGRYDRRTGRRLARFESPAGGPLIHMNGGIVLDGKLYCSHSNFPGVPMVSSIEIFDPKTLRHLGSQSFGVDAGSLVWMDRRDGNWWVCFGHYNGRGGQPGVTNESSVLVKMDSSFRRMAAYTFPKVFVDRWDGMTASGGFWGPDGLLYATGHHAPEIYVMRLPRMGSVLEPVKIIQSPVEGQGIAFDPATGELFQMQRKERMIYVLQLTAARR